MKQITKGINVETVTYPADIGPIQILMQTSLHL